MVGTINASHVRRAGFVIALDSLAFASWLTGWQTSFFGRSPIARCGNRLVRYGERGVIEMEGHRYASPLHHQVPG